MEQLHFILQMFNETDIVPTEVGRMHKANSSNMYCTLLAQPPVCRFAEWNSGLSQHLLQVAVFGNRRVVRLQG